MSVVHIIYPETMDETNTKARDQGLNDPKLGTIDRQFSCATCKEDISVCPGHFGHIELATPVFHVGECNCSHHCDEMLTVQASSSRSRSCSSRCASTAA
jgi:DNA-directed RNA polymerase beta' subunit